MAVLLGFSAYGIHRWWIIGLFLKNRRRAPQPLARFEQLPVVTVQLPIFNERYVAGRLLRAVNALDYPRELLEVQVLDDSTDDTRELIQREVATLQTAGLDIHYIHRTDRTGFKAGALENGMLTARGEYIFILDADFLPDADILHKTIHFFTDPRVGMIQTRWGHLNRTYSLLTRVQAMFLDGHLLLEQTARSRSGRFFNFNGTAGLWRRTCIETAGGWQHDTLTEDLDLSYRAQLEGWKFVFLSDVVTPAELPVDMNGFKSQQHRWTKGSIQTCKKILPRILRSKLPWKIKLEAALHLTSNFSYLLLAALCVLLSPTGYGGHGWLRFVLFDAPVFLAASVSVAVFYICAQRELYPQHLDAGNFPAASAHRTGHRTFAQQRPRRAGSHLQPDFRLRAHAQIRHRAASRRDGNRRLAQEPLPADQIAAAARRAWLCDLFHVLHLLRGDGRTIFHPAVPGALPVGFLLRGFFLAHAVGARPVALGAARAACLKK